MPFYEATDWRAPMHTLWIVHRDPQLRSAISRLAAAGDRAVSGAPSDPIFDRMPAAQVVVLGLAEDFESELQFAHRALPRLREATWILLAKRDRIEEAQRLFDTLDPEILGYPPDARDLRERIRSAPRHRGPSPLPLSLRPSRDVLGARFARWFADLEIPELLRALDPQLTEVPILITGEPGTGRSLLARYIHSFSGTAAGAFVEVVCTARTSPEELQMAVSASPRGSRARPASTLCLADVDRLSPPAQRCVRSWIEFAPPPGAHGASLARWIGTVLEPGRLEPGLRQLLGGLCLRIPPLRDRRQAVAPFANETALAWCRARAGQPRRLDSQAVMILEQYPWPGNLRELEATIVHSLSVGSNDPLRAADLQLEGEPFAPDLATESGTGVPLEPIVEAVAVEESEPFSKAEFEEPIAAIAATLLEDIDEPIAQALMEETEAESALEPERLREAEIEQAPDAAEAALRRLAGAVAHEVRNPLSTIRTFARLLPERYEDSEFRQQFAAVVDQDVMRIEEVVTRLGRLASFAPPKLESVDVAALLERILVDRRGIIRQQRLVVLQELDTREPFAVGDTDQLRFAFEALLNRCLTIVPERGDVYVASRHHDAGLHGRPSVRVLVRLRASERDAGPGSEPLEPAPAGLSSAENALELAITETIVRAQGGAFTIDASDRQETVIVLDLPA
jgi:DNA-binding NtrC family response regulator